MASSPLRCVLLASLLLGARSQDHSPGGFILSRPLVIHAGPAVDVGFGQSALSSLPLQDLIKDVNTIMGRHSSVGLRGFPRPRHAFFHDRFEDLKKQALFEEQFQPFQDEVFQRLEAITHLSEKDLSEKGDGFHVQEHGNHFKLSASLPGYLMHREEQKGRAQPLSIEVIGPSLVVRGQQADGSIMKSFQRSFRLPQTADAEGIRATYSNMDGSLAVTIPSKDAEPKRDPTKMWTFASQDDGSQTTLMISSGGVHDVSPMLQDMSEGLPSFLGPLFNFQQRPKEFPVGFLDRRSWNTLPRTSNDVLPSRTSTLMPASASADAQPKQAPLVVHRKDAKPFWRLAGSSDEARGGSSIEVVVPEGVEIGELNGSWISYGKDGGQLELPVTVRSGDCGHVEGAASREQVVQCKIQPSTVKKVPIKVSNEL